MSFAAENGFRPRLFAFARMVLFGALFVAANVLIGRYDRPLHRGVTSFEGHVLIEMTLYGLTVVGLTALLARFSGQSLFQYGLGGRHRLRNLAIGLACGLLFLAGQLCLMAALGVFAFGTASPIDAALGARAMLFAAAFGAVAFTEETLARGYTLVELSRALSFWPAAIVLAVLFGIPHWLKGDGETLLGGVMVAIDSLAVAYAVRATGSLWFAIGNHAGWDFAQSFLFGVPDSGTVSHGALMHPHIHGAAWLSGGTVGPEGSVLAVLPSIATALTAWALARRDGAVAKAP